jgi:hypothetical protein
MRTYYTYFDSNYLVYGLALYNSLLQHSTEDFELYVLCLDDKAYDILLQTKLKKIKPLKLTELEKTDNLLKLARQRFKPENGSVNYSHYCYAFSCWFTIYMLKNTQAKEILYIDSDIYFYSDPKHIFDETDSVPEKSVGLTKHRHVANYDCPFGFYNVGVLYFKNNKIALEAAEWWFDAYVNGKFPQWATCGDQKYLEGIEATFGTDNVYAIDRIGHAAPWNFRYYQYDFYPENKIMWGREKQELVFVHFSKFKPDYPNEKFSFSDHHYSWETMNFEVYKLEQVKDIYNKYFRTCLNIHKQLKSKNLL